MVELRCAANRRALAAALTAAALAAPAQEPEPRAPFITTPEEVVERMLALAGTGPQDYVIDLGSGDGRIVIAAARNFGARGLGVDIDGRLVALARENARRAGVAERAVFEERDALRTDLSSASVVTIYLLPSLIERLQPKLLHELRPGARIVSHAFGMKGWNPDRSERVRLSRRHEGQGDESTIHLWIVPAQARGEWQGEGWRLRVHQNFQEIEVEASEAGRPLAVGQASLSGAAIAFAGEGFAFSGRIEGDRMTGELARRGASQPLALRRR